MRHSKSLDAINYKKLVNCLRDDYVLLEDERAIWLRDESQIGYEPSDYEGELDSERQID